MKNYLGLRIMAGIFRIIGWMLVLFSVGLIVVALFVIGNAPVPTSNLWGAVSAFSFAWYLLSAVVIFVCGLLLIALGQLAYVFIDIAKGAFYIPEIATNSALTVTFFEHITGSSNRA